jgi:hypothetical protein
MIDDPFGSMEDAESEVIRKVWKWRPSSASAPLVSKPKLPRPPMLDKIWLLWFFKPKTRDQNATRRPA